MRTFTVTDYDSGDCINTGTIRAFGMRPQRIAASEPFCRNCAERAWPARVHGQWDEGRGATAIPFTPVFVEMSCGCTFGDASKSRPTTTPDTTGGAA